MRLCKHSQWHHEAFICLNNELNSNAHAVSTPHHLLSSDCIKSLQTLYVKTFTICHDFAPQFILCNFSLTETFAACLSPDKHSLPGCDWPSATVFPELLMHKPCSPLCRWHCGPTAKAGCKPQFHTMFCENNKS